MSERPEDPGTRDEVACQSPDPAKTDGVRIPAWKYDLVRAAILHAVDRAGPEGLAASDIADAVRARLSRNALDGLGSVTWHATTVKLTLEAQGLLCRRPGSAPARLVRPGA